MTLPVGQVLVGDCLEIMAEFPADSVGCCVTSPPYFGLRDYGMAGQIGLEESPDAYCAKLVDVFREVRRVLKPDATCWLNLGDSYNGSGKGGDFGNSPKQATNHGAITGRPMRLDCMKPKDMLGIPWMVAFALRADGWYLRSAIVWAKPNPMPESVTDRPTSSYEMVFLLSKNAKYWYDADAIAEPVTASSLERLGQNVEAQMGSDRANGGAKTNGNMKAVCFGGSKGTQAGDASGSRTYSGNEWKPGEGEITRNARNVWTIPTQGFSGAHFATFPPELPRRCILAGCPPGGVVLDPFFGSGTVGMVAAQLARQWIGIELNPEYAAMARRRTAQQGIPFAGDAV